MIQYKQCIHLNATTTTTYPPRKVCVCGGAGGIGQPLSMLMALDPNVKDIRWDPTAGSERGPVFFDDFFRC